LGIYQNKKTSSETVTQRWSSREELCRFTQEVSVLVDVDDGDAAGKPDDDNRIIVPPLDTKRKPLQLVLQELLLSFLKLKINVNSKIKI
jgi:hypothetical protein